MLEYSVNRLLPLIFSPLDDQNLVFLTLIWNGGNGVSNTINAQTTYILNPELMLISLCRVHWCLETNLDLVWLALSTVAAGIGCLVMKTSSQPSWRFFRTRSEEKNRTLPEDNHEASPKTYEEVIKLQVHIFSHYTPLLSVNSKTVRDNLIRSRHKQRNLH